MDYYSSQITKLIEELSKLPGVGAICRKKRWMSWLVL